MKNWSEYKPLIFNYEGRWISNWFSNMSLSNFTVDGIEFKSVENFYQAMKSSNTLEFFLVATAEPKASKKLGKEIQDPFKYLINSNNPFTGEKLKTIEESKLLVMEMGLKLKFKIPEWRDKLLATEDEMIIEWNNWGDRYWGVDIRDCKGENHLGRLLMKVREELKNEQRAIT